MPSAPITFHDRIDRGLDNQVMRTAIGSATGRLMLNRTRALASLADAERLRDYARQVRRHTLAHLDEYLAQFAAQVERLGGHVHWAADAAEANQIVCEIARAGQVRRVVKSKSMLTEETHLNHALEQAGLEVVETDLGEYIAQIDGDAPSHLIAPILHKTRQEIGQLFERKLAVPYYDDPTTLAGIARDVLRQTFLEADMGISGCNFGVASTGTVALVTNEGNADMCVTLPRIHVVMMGIERIVPTPGDLAVMLQLLARSATGQKLSVYTTMVSGPRRAGDTDGAQEYHVVLLDNGRSEILAGELAEILSCIRCGACLNVCPVYRSIGGHAYGATPYSGPVGSVLSPLLFGLEQYGDLAHASSLCGACAEACPVRIDLPGLLLKVRDRTVQAGQAPAWLRAGMWGFSLVARMPWLFQLSARAASIASHLVARNGWIRRLPPPLDAWTNQRDFPALATRSFQERWRQNQR